jgi:hypothetical protein
MSLYQVQKCLFDYMRAKEHAPPDAKPEINVEGYDLDDAERKAVSTLDIGAPYAMGTHPMIINGLCRSLGYRRADYRPLLAGSAVPQRRRTRWQKS